MKYRAAMQWWWVLVLALCLPAPAQADDGALLEQALNRALTTFEQALPQLAAEEFGVDVAAYHDALSLRRFQSGHWGGAVALDLVTRESKTGSCSQFAAFVILPPETGVVPLVLCPQFFTAGADALRELTILHEMVHVVAGASECQAMAFAAKIEMAAKGQFTSVNDYWQASGCDGSRYQLPG